MFSAGWGALQGGARRLRGACVDQPYAPLPRALDAAVCLPLASRSHPIGKMDVHVDEAGSDAAVRPMRHRQDCEARRQRPPRAGSFHAPSALRVQPERHEAVRIEFGQALRSKRSKEDRQIPWVNPISAEDRTGGWGPRPWGRFSTKCTCLGGRLPTHLTSVAAGPPPLAR